MFHHWIYCVLWESWNISWSEAHERKSVYVLISFFWIYTYRFVNRVVTVIPLIPYYYQLCKIPNKNQTDFQTATRNSHYISMRRCSPARILYVDNPRHCFVSSKMLQPKIYLRSFYELLLLLATDYSVTMTSHQEKKKMTFLIFLLYLYFTEQRKKWDVLLLYILVFDSIDSNVLSKLTTYK